MKYLIIYEKSKTGFGAYVPDLPGIGVTGGTMELTKSRIMQAIKMYVDDLHAEGQPIPEPTTVTEYVEVA